MGGGEYTLATGDGTRGEAEEDEDVPIFDKHDAVLHGESKTVKYVSSRFMKKYIHVARALKVRMGRGEGDVWGGDVGGGDVWGGDVWEGDVWGGDVWGGDVWGGGKVMCGEVMCGEGGR